MGDPPDRGAHVAGLASLPGLSTRVLARLLERHEPPAALARVARGAAGPEAARAALGLDLDVVEAALAAADVVATCRHDAAHPGEVLDDPAPAPVLFWRHRPGLPSAPRVAVVGTRRPTATGREVAAELGAALAAAGVVVVSGLALGIDGAAHRGALAAGGAPPVGVVGSGLDVVYPRRHEGLWDEVGRRGRLLGEAPLGAEPAPWRFPARNRLIAAMADVVVVVESALSGGSMSTVEEAIRRGVEVMAVPGSVRNPAAAGTNRLIADGCAPVCDPADVVVAVGRVAPPGAPPVPGAGVPGPGGAGPPIVGVEAEVLDALDDGSISLDRLVDRVAAPAPVVAGALGRLVAAGSVVVDGDGVRRVIAP